MSRPRTGWFVVGAINAVGWLVISVGRLTEGDGSGAFDALLISVLILSLLGAWSGLPERAQ